MICVALGAALRMGTAACEPAAILAAGVGVVPRARIPGLLAALTAPRKGHA